MSDIKEELEKIKKSGIKYKLIYSDPPWKYTTRSDKGKGKSAEKHYSVMSLEDIKNLPVNDITEKDSVLFIWVTDPLLPEALEVIKAWGFTYKTVGFTWRKTYLKSGKDFFGLGYYTRSNPEMCLIATKGSPPRVTAKNIRQIFASPVREHSRKPDEMYDWIEALYPGIDYLEMFARNEPRANWTKLGNETGKL